MVKSVKPFIEVSIRPGIIASAIAANTTIGVYTFANFVMKFSGFALFSVEFSTSSRIRATVESE